MVPRLLIRREEPRRIHTETGGFMTRTGKEPSVTFRRHEKNGLRDVVQRMLRMGQYLRRTSINLATRNNIVFHNPPVPLTMDSNSAVATARWYAAHPR
jgi:hypothetical protein